MNPKRYPAPAAYGVWNRNVCWLVGPTAYDVKHMPENFTLVYEISGARGLYANMPPPVLFSSIDREEIAAESRHMYAQRKPHYIHTQWRAPNGDRVNKPAWVYAMKFGDQFGVTLQNIDEKTALQIVRHYEETYRPTEFGQAVSRIFRAKAKL